MKVHRRSHGHSIVCNVHTQINVHFLWLPWMAMSCTTNLQEMDPKHEFINYFKQMPSRKIAVIIPAVCFWVSVKCMESFCIRSNSSLTRFSKIESTALHVNTPWKICSKQKMLSCNGSIGISIENRKRMIRNQEKGRHEAGTGRRWSLRRRDQLCSV